MTPFVSLASQFTLPPRPATLPHMNQQLKAVDGQEDKVGWGGARETVVTQSCCQTTARLIL